MNIIQAKDFLVEQTTAQALLDGMPLSDLEKRMMYFTEGKDALEDPSKLNEEFDAEYDSAKYKSKISRLLHRACKRLKKEYPSKLTLWNEAIRVIRKGDHYILVLWGSSLSGERPVGLSLRMWAALLLLSALGIGGKFSYGYLTKASPPLGHPRLLLAIFVGIIAANFLFPRQIERVGGWFLDKVLFRFMEPKGKEEDGS
jgi:hypothetical protein